MNKNIEEMERIANAIQKIEEQLLDNKISIEKDRQWAAETELEEMQLIENALTKDSKKLYTNETKRKIALKDKLSGSKAYITTLAKTKELELDTAKARIKRDFLVRMFKVHEMILLRGEGE